jgi:hypothetical protein
MLSLKKLLATSLFVLFLLIPVSIHSSEEKKNEEHAKGIILKHNAKSPVAIGDWNDDHQISLSNSQEVINKALLTASGHVGTKKKRQRMPRSIFFHKTFSD